MNNYIYTYKYSISKEICKDIINLFENDTENHYKGVTYGGLNIDVKNTIDYQISSNNPKWTKISKLLINEINKHCKIYLNTIPFHTMSEKEFEIKNFQLQKYIKNEGKYIYHDDEHIINNNNKRVLTFIWYLNDVLEGGETELLKCFHIKPESGKLLIFPSCWTFPHCGSIPISNDKYILTGWIYKKI